MFRSTTRLGQVCLKARYVFDFTNLTSEAVLRAGRIDLPRMIGKQVRERGFVPRMAGL